ncbi:MAG: hypothetical protein WDM90_15505 [Ferruginibacter sp.]
MPGFELWSDAERKHINDVSETGILMRYGFDGPRKGIWKAKELEQELCKFLNCNHAQLVSSGHSGFNYCIYCIRYWLWR